MLNFRILTAGLLLALLSVSALAGLDTDIRRLQHRWAEVNYQLEGKTRLTAFQELADDAEAVVDEYPDRAEPLIWSGIIKSTFAGAKGGLGALGLARGAREDLEKALELNPEALNGSAYTSLGTLYYNVPGWPLGFGDDDKAEELLRKALTVNPDGIDSNYFYGKYLLGEKRYNKARTYLEKANNAPPRPDRKVADSGRHKEIADALTEVVRALE